MSNTNAIAAAVAVLNFATCADWHGRLAPAYDGMNIASSNVLTESQPGNQEHTDWTLARETHWLHARLKISAITMNATIMNGDMFM